MKPITRGRIAAIDSYIETVDDLTDVVGQNTLNGEPSSAINIHKRGQLRTGQEYAAGTAATIAEDRHEVPRIHADGTIERKHEDTTKREFSVWAIVPAAGFGVYWEEFALGQLMHRYSGIHDAFEQAIWLNDFYSANETHLKNISSVGYKARQVADGAKKGTVHGRNVPSDPALGSDLEGHRSLLNELRYDHVDPDGLHAPRVEAYLCASGYLEVYGPDEVETEQFLSYIQENILRHTEDAEDFAEAVSEGDPEADPGHEDFRGDTDEPADGEDGDDLNQKLDSLETVEVREGDGDA